MHEKKRDETHPGTSIFHNDDRFSFLYLYSFIDYSTLIKFNGEVCHEKAKGREGERVPEAEFSEAWEADGRDRINVKHDLKLRDSHHIKEGNSGGRGQNQL